MTIDCIECGAHAADRTEFEKYHTTWKCRACGVRFEITLRGDFVERDGRWVRKEPKEATAHDGA